MKTEQIVVYLMVTTVMMIFFVLVLYTINTTVGNGGEYWGYDGSIEPYMAAAESFESGNYRFLDVNLPPYDDLLTDFVPGVMGCPQYSDSNELEVFRSSETLLHAADSVRLATGFARSYNQTMARALNRELDAGCVTFLPM